MSQACAQGSSCHTRLRMSTARSHCCQDLVQLPTAPKQLHFQRAQDLFVGTFTRHPSAYLNPSLCTQKPICLATYLVKTAWRGYDHPTILSLSLLLVIEYQIACSQVLFSYHCNWKWRGQYGCTLRKTGLWAHILTWNFNLRLLHLITSHRQLQPFRHGLCDFLRSVRPLPRRLL